MTLRIRNFVSIAVTYFTLTSRSVSSYGHYAITNAKFVLNGTAKHPDMQKIRIIGFFSENRLQWQYEVLLLLLTICTCA